MPIGRNVGFGRDIHDVLAMEDEEACQNNDNGADQNLAVRQFAEENIAQHDCPEQQAVLKRGKEGGRSELQGARDHQMRAARDDTQRQHRDEVEGGH